MVTSVVVPATTWISVQKSLGLAPSLTKKRKTTRRGSRKGHTPKLPKRARKARVALLCDHDEAPRPSMTPLALSNGSCAVQRALSDLAFKVGKLPGDHDAAPPHAMTPLAPGHGSRVFQRVLSNPGSCKPVLLSQQGRSPHESVRELPAEEHIPDVPTTADSTDTATGSSCDVNARWDFAALVFGEGMRVIGQGCTVGMRRGFYAAEQRVALPHSIWHGKLLWSQLYFF